MSAITDSLSEYENGSAAANRSISLPKRSNSMRELDHGGVTTRRGRSVASGVVQRVVEPLQKALARNLACEFDANLAPNLARESDANLARKLARKLARVCISTWY